jgi:hypothetical protein
MIHDKQGTTATLFNDTWEWDGENWTQYEDIGPAPRSRHGMAHESARRRALVATAELRLIDDGIHANGTNALPAAFVLKRPR